MKPFGDRALRFAVSGDARHRRALLEALRALPGVVDAIVAEEEACVVLDEGAAPAEIERAIASLRVDDAAIAPREHRIEVVYDGEDLDAVARATGLSRSAVIDAHAAPSYVVSLVGFMPGFAYLRGLDERLVLPRRPSPRPRVRARSVAIAARYTAVYPSASPGGWHLLGRAPAFVPFALALGDGVRFAPAASVPEAPIARARADAPIAAPYVEVARVQGFAHVVGAPIHGRMHEGVPPGGPLVSRVPGGSIEVFGSVTLAWPGGTLTVSSGGARVAYAGVDGGFAPLGPIARGDRLALARPAEPFAIPIPSPAAERIAVMLGPDDVARAAIDVLLGSTFTVAPASNRVGTRLEGPPVPTTGVAHDRASAPMVKGAIEVTPAGLVVLGPDHPTTGGYPVLAGVRAHAMDALFTHPAGSKGGKIQFVAE